MGMHHTFTIQGHKVSVKLTDETRHMAHIMGMYSPQSARCFVSKVETHVLGLAVLQSLADKYLNGNQPVWRKYIEQLQGVIERFDANSLSAADQAFILPYAEGDMVHVQTLLQVLGDIYHALVLIGTTDEDVSYS